MVWGVIGHEILKNILAKHIEDKDTLWLLGRVIDSFPLSTKLTAGNLVDIRLPLGNLTSQLLVNIYMNEFDHFVKMELKAKYYIRYADDFVILSEDKKYLENMLLKMAEFLENRLKLKLHPDKVFIKTIASGVDFLGWVHFPHHRVLRTATRRRMLKNLRHDPKKESIESYRGMLSHGDAFGLSRDFL